MFKMNIAKWYGRLGNNLIQLSHAVFLAKRYQGVVSFPKHDLIETQEIDFRAENQIEREINSNFWFHDIDNPEFFSDYDFSLFGDYKKDYFMQRPNILREYVFPLFHYDNLEVPYDMTIHMRGGDIFWSKQKDYVQCPHSYFLKIIEEENPNNILLLSEDKLNPVVDMLLSDKNLDITHQSSTLSKDVNTILNSNVLVCGGYSSFSSIVPMMSPKIKKLYFPDFDTIRDYDILNLGDMETEVVTVSFDDYTRIGEWQENENWFSDLLSFPKNKIKFSIKNAYI